MCIKSRATQLMNLQIKRKSIDNTHMLKSDNFLYFCFETLCTCFDCLEKLEFFPFPNLTIKREKILLPMQMSIFTYGYRHELNLGYKKDPLKTLPT